MIGRPTGVMVGTSQITDLYYSTSWTYDDQGRLERVTGPEAGLGGIAAKYEYDPYGNTLRSPRDTAASGGFAAKNPFSDSGDTILINLRR